VGATDTQSIVLHNCGNTSVVVSSVVLAGGPGASNEFSVALNGTVPAIIAPQWTMYVTVTYTPTDPVPFGPDGLPELDTQTVVITSNAGDPKSIPLDGWATAPCPSANVFVLEGEEVVPQTVLHLGAQTSSFPSGGKVQKYEWQAKQPAGSGKAFEPLAGVANPTFTPDVVGEYTFCLRVWDQNGTISCEAACTTVLVVPTGALYVQLLWDTPADETPYDGGAYAGADLDLHFADAMAQAPDLDCDGAADPWFSNPFDAFWFNKHPNWGGSGPGDDPFQLLDDTDGDGPESLTVEAPETAPSGAFVYTVGVHYWNDYGFGVSHASLSAYVQGTLALNLDKVALNPLDFWTAARIHWPNELVGGTQPAFTVCHQSGDACLAKQDPANPKGGKLWQPSGAMCITPCYVNTSFGSGAGGPVACKP
jgi:hypothetical protein